MKKKLLLTLIFLSISKIAFADIVEDTLDFNNDEISGFTSVSTVDDARSLLINPGSIGIKDAIEMFFSTSVVSDFKQFNLVGMYGNFNGGIQQFTPQNKKFPTIRKLFAGTGYPIIQGLSVGISYSNVQDVDNPLNSNASSIDVGLVTRIYKTLSLGLVGKNINNPIFNKNPIARSYLVSLGFMPASWDRLVITAEGEWVEGSDLKRTRAKLGLETELIDGVIINAYGASDLYLKTFSFGAQLGLTVPYASLGYGRIFDTKSKDAAYLKLTTIKDRNLLEQMSNGE